MAEQLKKSEQEWKEVLDKHEYHVLREKGTERPFTGKYHAEKSKGTYKCRGCGAPLFSSDTKFDSGTGWPSFSDVMANENVRTQTDHSHGMTRVEVLCAKCGGHLGHVFPDGPTPSGMRYCINSCSLELETDGGGRK
jgi:peptide-methionine (R)-S-oxide reductase